MPSDLHSSSPQHVRRLVSFGYIGLGVAAVYFWQSQEWENPLLSVTNLVMLALGVVPMLQWLRRNDATYPIIETLLLTTVPFYAIPALTGHEALRLFDENTILRSSFVVIAFQLSCIGGGTLAAQTFHKRQRMGHEWWANEVLPEEKLGFTAYSACVATVWVGITNFTQVVPSEWMGTLRAVFFGVSIISVFIQARLWGAGLLSPGFKVLFVVNVTIQVLFMFVSLLLISGMGLLLTAGIGYFSVARRVPWVPVLALVPLLAVLHNGKTQMRQIYWEGQRPSPGIVDLPGYFTDWVTLGLQSHEAQKEKTNQAMTYGLMRRASLFQIVCIAVDSMPDRAPFLYGKSYWILLPQVLPRFLWPTKPSPHLSIRMLSVQLGILDAEGAEFTSVGFGMLSEGYANFGFVSISLLGATFGFLFRRLAVASEDCATLSPAGLFRILCLVWCLSAETTLAVWFSSLYQACIAVGVPLLALRSFVSK